MDEDDYQRLRERLLGQFKAPAPFLDPHKDWQNATRKHVFDQAARAKVEQEEKERLRKRAEQLNDSIERLEQVARERAQERAQKYGSTTSSPATPTYTFGSDPNTGTLNPRSVPMVSGTPGGFSDWAEKLYKTPRGRKIIKSVSLDITYENGLQNREWKDHDGERVHETLGERLEHVFRQNKGTAGTLDLDVQRVLDVWNNDDTYSLKSSKRLTVAPIGHKSRCLYNGSHDYPCNCQPTTLWADAEMWLCDCCNEPRSAIRFGLCDLCKCHQYADGHNAEIEHDARRQSE